MVAYFSYIFLIVFLVLCALAVWVVSLGTLIGQYRHRRVLSLKHIHLLLIPLTSVTLYFCFEVSMSSYSFLGGTVAAGKKCLAAVVALIVCPYAGLLLLRYYQTARPQVFETGGEFSLFEQGHRARYAIGAAVIGGALTVGLFAVEFGPRRLLVHAARSNDLSTVKLLVDWGADINVTDGLHHAPLWYACRNGNLEMVKLFLANGADLSFSHPASLLDIASYHGRTDVVRLLLDRGIDVNATSSDGQTALMAASRGCKPETAALLIERGANVNAATKNLATALIYACDHWDISVAKLLLAKGADPNVKATYGDSPLIHAVRRNNGELTLLLKAHGAKGL